MKIEDYFAKRRFADRLEALTKWRVEAEKKLIADAGDSGLEGHETDISKEFQHQMKVLATRFDTLFRDLVELRDHEIANPPRDVLDPVVNDTFESMKQEAAGHA